MKFSRFILITTTMVVGTLLTGCGTDNVGSKAETIATTTTTIATTTTVEETTTTTTTEQKTTTTEYILYAGEAESLAKDFVKFKYSKYEPVIIGDVVTENDERSANTFYYRVVIKGHYWVTDDYGHNAGSKDFEEKVYVDKKTGWCHS